MIRVKTCFVAEGVITDRDTDQISAFGLLENLHAESYPLSVQKLAFFCLWGRSSTDPQRATCEFSITLNGKDLVRQGVDIDFQQYLHDRCTIRLDGFALSEPGSVVFRLAIPGHETAEWALEAGRGASGASGTVHAAGSSRIYESNPVSISVGNVNVHRR
jgi:hypothetical protein